MALAQTQALLARLFVDASLRRRFFDAPISVAQRFGLSEAEARNLSTIDRHEVESFARSLFGKRALDLRKAMPLTARAMGDKFDAVLMDVGAVTRHGDARALAEHLSAMAARRDGADYLSDIARFELAFIEASRPGIWIRRFTYDMKPIVSALKAGAQIRATRRLVIGLWWRLPGAGLRWRLLAAPRLQARR